MTCSIDVCRRAINRVVSGCRAAKWTSYCNIKGFRFANSQVERANAVIRCDRDVNIAIVGEGHLEVSGAFLRHRFGAVAGFGNCEARIGAKVVGFVRVSSGFGVASSVGKAAGSSGGVGVLPGCPRSGDHAFVYILVHI